MPYDAYQSVALAAARCAGEVIVEGFGAHHALTFKKSHSDLVTAFDKKAEREIVRIISEAFPDHQIVAEEGSTGAEQHDYCWYIDPIDGTTNFAHAYPIIATSIGLAFRGELVMGVVYNPILNELFVGAKGRGATLNGAPIHVSATAELERGLLATGFPYDRSTIGLHVDCLVAFLHHSQGVRRDGSAALDICSVAAGRFDGFWEFGFSAWDMAAGLVILREAGGTITLPSGEPLYSVSREVVASNGLIHQDMLRVLTTVAQQHA